MNFEFNLDLCFYGSHSFAWRAKTAALEELRVLAAAAITSGDFVGLAAWANGRRKTFDARRRASLVKISKAEDQRVTGLVSALLKLLPKDQQVKVPRLSLAGKQVSSSQWKQLSDSLEHLHEHRAEPAAARVYRTLLNRSVLTIQRLQRAAFVPSKAPASPAESLRLALDTTLNFDAGEFGMGGYWGDLLDAPRALADGLRFGWLFPSKGRDASVDRAWLKLVPSEQESLGAPWTVSPAELPAFRDALDRAPPDLHGHLAADRGAAPARITRMNQLVVEPPPWGWTFRDTTGRTGAGERLESRGLRVTRLLELRAPQIILQNDLSEGVRAFTEVARG